MENGDAQDDQDGELVETMEELKPQHGNLEEEKFEDIGECCRSLERQFTYCKRTDRVAFPLEYSPKVYQSTERSVLLCLTKH